MTSNGKPITVRVTNWRPVPSKSSLKGYATVRIDQMRLNIYEVGCFRKEDGTTFAMLPSKPMVNRDGVAMRGADGRIRWQAMVEIDDPDFRKAFSRRVIHALQEFEPSALDE
jgi:hypothetical protein